MSDGLTKLIQYVNTVAQQIDQLTDPSRPDPSQEQVNKYTTTVVSTLKNLSTGSPPIVKDKINQSFTGHWNVSANKPAKDPITPLLLSASFKMLTDQLSQEEVKGGKGAGKAGKAGKGGKGGEEEGEKEEKEQPRKTYEGENMSDFKILPNPDLVGRIVGPQGKTLRTIEFETQTRLDINGDSISISGPKDGVEAAMKAIDDIISKGYSPLFYAEDFAEQQLKVSQRLLPDIIGTAWKNMKIIREKFNVEIGIPESGNKGAKGEGKGKGKPEKKATITIAGKAADVEQAKEIIKDLSTKFFHPLTHPGQAVKEVEVDHEYLNVLIGSRGSEIKHMQNSFEVKVYIPNEVNQNENVVIVGEEYRLEQCEKHINNLITRIQSRPQRGEEQYDRDDNRERYGEEEDWEQSYVIRR